MSRQNTQTHSLPGMKGNCPFTLSRLASRPLPSSAFSLASAIRLWSWANPVSAGMPFLTLVCPTALRKSEGITTHWIHLARKMTNRGGREWEHRCPPDLSSNLSLWKAILPSEGVSAGQGHMPLRIKESKVDVSCFFLSKHSTNSTARQLAKLPL